MRTLRRTAAINLRGGRDLRYRLRASVMLIKSGTKRSSWTANYLFFPDLFRQVVLPVCRLVHIQTAVHLDRGRQTVISLVLALSLSPDPLLAGWRLQREETVSEFPPVLRPRTAVHLPHPDRPRSSLRVSRYTGSRQSPCRGTCAPGTGRMPSSCHWSIRTCPWSPRRRGTWNDRGHQVLGSRWCTTTDRLTRPRRWAAALPSPVRPWRGSPRSWDRTPLADRSRSPGWEDRRSSRSPRPPCCWGPRSRSSSCNPASVRSLAAVPMPSGWKDRESVTVRKTLHSNCTVDVNTWL